jgi:prepilin-type N-terminal cleavage/methylation domain-containing protein
MSPIRRFFVRIKNNMSFNKAFTLLELLVVITIIGILTSIVVVSMSGSTDSATIAKGKSYAQQVHALLGSEAVLDLNFNENAFDTCPDGKDTCDASGYNNNGTISGAVYVSSPVDGYALSFDGVDDYVDLPANSTSLQLGNTGTITAWVKANSFSQSINIIYTSTGNLDVDKAPYIYCGADGKLVAKLGGTTQQTIISDIYLSVEQWYFILFKWDGSNVWLYANDSIYTTAQIVTNQFTGDFRIGRWIPITPERIWNGLIDEVRIYSEALPSTEIQKHYVQGLEKLLFNQVITQAEYDQRVEDFNQSLANE